MSFGHSIWWNYSFIFFFLIEYILYWYNSSTHHAHFDLCALLFFSSCPSPGMPLQCSPCCFKSFFKDDFLSLSFSFLTCKMMGLEYTSEILKFCESSGTVSCSHAQPVALSPKNSTLLNC